MEYMKFKDPKSKGRQDVPGSPTQKHGRKVSRDQAISPRQGRTKQHLQILVRHYSKIQSQKVNLSNFLCKFLVAVIPPRVKKNFSFKG